MFYLVFIYVKQSSAIDRNEGMKKSRDGNQNGNSNMFDVIEELVSTKSLWIRKIIEP
jgi:hypothetical protein